jgi:hypothetical protein
MRWEAARLPKPEALTRSAQRPVLACESVLSLAAERLAGPQCALIMSEAVTDASEAPTP